MNSAQNSTTELELPSMPEKTLTQVDDGGQAFPGVETPAGGIPGMTLRDYFAAHAPARRWGHFHPQMPPRPEPDWTGISEDHRFDVSPSNWVQIDSWKAEERRQFELQWPYFYADAMLTERVKQEGR